MEKAKYANTTIVQALKMDVKSDEFFEIYKLISDKYWDFENPDELQQAAKALVMFAERYEADKIILATKIILQVVEMAKNKSSSCTGSLVFENNSYFFDIYESETKRDELTNALKRASDNIDKGKFTVKNKKDKFGKKYF